tara:strand:+ start:180 stop:638 length:459 start_codon:yes stop_codon:yes gene_type:complete
MSTCSVKLNKTYTHKLKNLSFDKLSENVVINILKDGRPFSHFIELWLEETYPLKHIKGCKEYDFIDLNNSEIKYDEKTFTKGGCKFCPSSMLGTGRKFNKKIFQEKAKNMIYIIVSNINLPEIKIKFVSGCELIKIYPKGIIPLRDHVKFFN